MERAHLGRGLQDLGAERHDGAQHGQEPEDEEHAGGLDAVQPLALDQERGQQLRREGRGVRLAQALRGRGGQNLAAGILKPWAEPEPNTNSDLQAPCSVVVPTETKTEPEQNSSSTWAPRRCGLILLWLQITD